MAPKKILFISGSAGLGHLTRDIHIARELRRQYPTVEIAWLSAPSMNEFLVKAGEQLHPVADQYGDDNIPAEKDISGYRGNILKYVDNAKATWAHNVDVFKKITREDRYDVIIGDETYEIVFAANKEPDILTVPFVMIYDCLGGWSMSGNPLEMLGIYMLNRTWSNTRKLHDAGKLHALFVGELEDIPDKGFGFLLPHRRDFARAYFEFIGYVVPPDIEEYADKRKARAELGYGGEPLVICTIGGTANGKALLELCIQTFSLAKERIPNLRMLLVYGPRLSPDSFDLPEGIEVKGYVSALYKHLGASDLVVTMGGGTTTLELTALGRPFLYFPFGHFEQEIYVADRIARQQAGVRMEFYQTTPEILAEAITNNLNKEVCYGAIPTDGAQRAARFISQFLKYSGE